MVNRKIETSEEDVCRIICDSSGVGTRHSKGIICQGKDVWITEKAPALTHKSFSVSSPASALQVFLGESFS